MGGFFLWWLAMLDILAMLGFLAMLVLGGAFEAAKQAGEGEGGAEACVEKGKKGIGDAADVAQHNAQGHHKGNDKITFEGEELVERCLLAFHGMDALDILAYNSEKHEGEQGKD